MQNDQRLPLGQVPSTYPNTTPYLSPITPSSIAAHKVPSFTEGHRVPGRVPAVMSENKDEREEDDANVKQGRKREANHALDDSDTETDDSDNSDDSEMEDLDDVVQKAKSKSAEKGVQRKTKKKGKTRKKLEKRELRAQDELPPEADPIGITDIPRGIKNTFEGIAYDLKHVQDLPRDQNVAAYVFGRNDRPIYIVFVIILVVIGALVIKGIVDYTTKPRCLQQLDMKPFLGIPEEIQVKRKELAKKLPAQQKYKTVYMPVAYSTEDTPRRIS